MSHLLLYVGHLPLRRIACASLHVFLFGYLQTFPPLPIWKSCIRLRVLGLFFERIIPFELLCYRVIPFELLYYIFHSVRFFLVQAPLYIIHLYHVCACICMLVCMYKYMLFMHRYTMYIPKKQSIVVSLCRFWRIVMLTPYVSVFLEHETSERLHGKTTMPWRLETTLG